jgi:hypothetical protein
VHPVTGLGSQHTKYLYGRLLHADDGICNSRRFRDTRWPVYKVRTALPYCNTSNEWLLNAVAPQFAASCQHQIGTCEWCCHAFDYTDSGMPPAPAVIATCSLSYCNNTLATITCGSASIVCSLLYHRRIADCQPATHFFIRL